MKIDDIVLKEFREVGKDLFAQHLLTSHGGNLSILAGEKIIITRRGAMLHRLEPEDLIITSLYKDDENSQLASRELPVHRAIYLATGDGAIVHAHPPAATALSFREEPFIPVDKEGSFLLKEVPVSEEIPEVIARALAKAPAVLVAGHGSFAKGASLYEGLHWTTTLEASANIWLLKRRIG